MTCFFRWLSEASAVSAYDADRSSMIGINCIVTLRSEIHLSKPQLAVELLYVLFKASAALYWYRLLCICPPIFIKCYRTVVLFCWPLINPASAFSCSQGASKTSIFDSRLSAGGYLIVLHCKMISRDEISFHVLALRNASRQRGRKTGEERIQ